MYNSNLLSYHFIHTLHSFHILPTSSPLLSFYLHLLSFFSFHSPPSCYHSSADLTSHYTLSSLTLNLFLFFLTLFLLTLNLLYLFSLPFFSFSSFSLSFFSFSSFILSFSSLSFSFFSPSFLFSLQPYQRYALSEAEHIRRTPPSFGLYPATTGEYHTDYGRGTKRCL